MLDVATMTNKAGMGRYAGYGASLVCIGLDNDRMSDDQFELETVSLEMNALLELPHDSLIDVLRTQPKPNPENNVDIRRFARMDPPKLSKLEQQAFIEVKISIGVEMNRLIEMLAPHAEKFNPNRKPVSGGTAFSIAHGGAVLAYVFGREKLAINLENYAFRALQGWDAVKDE